MKKFVALLTASVMMASMTVCAAGSPTAAAVVASSSPASEGFSQAADQQAAAERGMSAGEYYNNAITETPGLPSAMPVGQGGKIIINGVATNLTASLAKAPKAVVTSASAQATALGGTLLNVVKVDFPGANYKVATINFYLKGLVAGKKVVAKQYVNGAWVDVEVAEVRADHVVLNLKNVGAVAFVELP